MLLLPASRASSTYASCKDQGIGSVVPAHNQVPIGIQAGGSAVELTTCLSHHHPPPRHITGSAGEQRKNRVLIFANNRIYRRQQLLQNPVARNPPALVNAQRGRLTFQIRREQRMI